MRIAQVATGSAAIVTLMGCGASKGQSVDPPTRAQAQTLLEAAFLDNTNPNRHQTLTIDAMQCGAARLGDDLVDGTPPNRETQVVPCIVTYHTTSVFSNFPALSNLIKSEANLVFFTDDVGRYVFKLKSAQNQMCSVDGSNCRKF